MKKIAISLVAILALALALPAVRAPALIRVVPVAPPGTIGTAGSGAIQITLGSPGTYTIPLNFTIHVLNNLPAGNIAALFILNHTNPGTLSGTPSMVETGFGSPDAGTAGNALTPHGPFTDVPFAYDVSIPGGVGQDHVFDGSLPQTSYYNFTWVWTGLTGPLNPAWKLINVTFTVPNGSVSTANPAQFIVVGAGPSLDDTGAPDPLHPYATPWSGATNIVVIPEFLIGTIAAVVLPLIALAGYMHFKGSRQSPAVSLNS